jgi:hypothetical protein
MINKYAKLGAKDEYSKQSLNTFRSAKLVRKLNWAFIKSKFTVQEKLDKEKEEWSKFSFIEKYQYIIEIPITILRKLTIPIADEDQYSKLLVTIMPITFIAYFIGSLGFYTIKLLGFSILWWGLGIGAVLSICVHFTTSKR